MAARRVTASPWESRLPAQVQADRAADGTSVPDTYRPLTSPGVWVPTTPPSFAQYARARPWVLKSADQFRPGPPPQLSSALYARDYNETKALGGTRSTARTPEQTEAVKFWGRPISARPGKRQHASFRRRRDFLSPRMHACSRCSTWPQPTPSSATGMPNSPITSGARSRPFATATWTQRRYRTRPRLDAVGNDTDASRIPIAGEHYLRCGDRHLRIGVRPKPAIRVTATDLVDPKRQRQFNNIDEMADEHINVRIWGGIHFRNSLEVGNDMGKKIAAYLIENALEPAR